MKAYQERVVVEASDLKEKLIALRRFIDEDALFDGLSQRNKGLLLNQERYMTSYAHVLSDRIDGFEAYGTPLGQETGNV